MWSILSFSKHDRIHFLCNVSHCDHCCNRIIWKEQRQPVQPWVMCFVSVENPVLTASMCLNKQGFNVFIAQIIRWLLIPCVIKPPNNAITSSLGCLIWHFSLGNECICALENFARQKFWTWFKTDLPVFNVQKNRSKRDNYSVANLWHCANCWVVLSHMKRIVEKCLNSNMERNSAWFQRGMRVPV